MSTLAHSEPLPPSERADLLDALRGFALFGVLTSNMVGFSGALMENIDPSATATLVQELRPARVLAMFMIGLWIGRRALYAHLDAHVGLLRKTLIWGLLIGLPASAAMA